MNYYSIFITDVFFKKSKKEILNDLLKKTIEVTGISEEILKSKNRKRTIADTRAAFWILAKSKEKPNLKFSTTLLADIFKRNHATVLHALKKKDISDVAEIVTKINEAL